MIPRSRSASEGRVHLASGAVLAPSVVIVAEEEENPVLMWVRVDCAIAGEVRTRGAKMYTLPVLLLIDKISARGVKRGERMRQKK